MKKLVTENFRFTITVIDGQHCRNGHEVGDTFSCEYGCPMPCSNEGGFCAKTMLKLFPLLEIVRAGGDLRTLGGRAKHSCEFTCPDGVIKFSLEAQDLASIQPLNAQNLHKYADVIRRSFATVAQDFGWTRDNCPGHTSFITNERLASKIKDGYYPFGLCISEKIIGFVSLTDMGGGVYEMNDVSVLPNYRHFGYGKELLDFSKAKVKELRGSKITIGIVEENVVLKDWYIANGFVHIGTKQFEHLPFMVGFMEWRA